MRNPAPTIEEIAQAIQQQRPDAAERLARAYLAFHPDDETGLLLLGMSLQAQTRSDAAIEVFRELTRLLPDSALHWGNLGTLLRDAKRGDEAEAALRRALELDPRNAAAHYNLARQFEESGEAAPALDHYRQFLQYAGPDQSGYAPDVRTRIAALQGRMK